MCTRLRRRAACCVEPVPSALVDLGHLLVNVHARFLDHLACGRIRPPFPRQRPRRALTKTASERASSGFFGLFLILSQLRRAPSPHFLLNEKKYNEYFENVRDFLKNPWKSRKIRNVSSDRALDDLAAELEVVRRDDLHHLR